jgi:hypothetical protein
MLVYANKSLERRGMAPLLGPEDLHRHQEKDEGSGNEGPQHCQRGGGVAGKAWEQETENRS